MKIIDMPKLKSPFVRKVIDGNYIVTDEIEEGYDWVFEDDTVMAIEKLHGTNVSIEIRDGQIVGIWNRTERIPFFCRGKGFIVKGVLNSFDKKYMEFLGDGQHFGELIGPKVNGNPYNLEENLWIPFESYGQKHLAYTCWGKYPKTFESIREWFRELMPLYSLRIHGKILGVCPFPFVEGIVFTHPDGRMAKLRRDMFDWFEGRRHNGGNKKKNDAILGDSE